MKEHLLAPDPIQITKGLTYVCSAATCWLAWINANGVFLGFCLGALSYLTSLIFQWRRDRREKWNGVDRRSETR